MEEIDKIVQRADFKQTIISCANCGCRTKLRRSMLVSNKDIMGNIEVYAVCPACKRRVYKDNFIVIKTKEERMLERLWKNNSRYEVKKTTRKK